MNSVTQKQIDDIVKESVFTSEKMGDKTTVLHCRLPNGFELVESSACVDPKNYNHAMGVELCETRLINRLWQLEGYRLQCELARPAEPAPDDELAQTLRNVGDVVLDLMKRGFSKDQANDLVEKVRYWLMHKPGAGGWIDSGIG